MHADPKGVLAGTHFIDGDHACCEGALAAGARFAAGYPITPSTEVVERFAARIPTVGGVFVQMEDELAASIAIQGAVWAGAKAFTVTSGPGFSLMMEHIGYAAMTETPCVFVNVQRGGPSTGLPTLPAQADMMQARWGSHGDYGMIALCPNSPQQRVGRVVVAHRDHRPQSLTHSPSLRQHLAQRQPSGSLVDVSGVENLKLVKAGDIHLSVGVDGHSLSSVEMLYQYGPRARRRPDHRPDNVFQRTALGGCNTIIGRGRVQQTTVAAHDAARAGCESCTGSSIEN